MQERVRIDLAARIYDAAHQARLNMTYVIHRFPSRADCRQRGKQAGLDVTTPLPKGTCQLDRYPISNQPGLIGGGQALAKLPERIDTTEVG